MGKVGRPGYSAEFRRKAVERLKNCDNVEALARELGVHRRSLYYWRDEFAKGKKAWADKTREAADRKQILELKRLLAEKTLEVDFFRGALQKIETRRQNYRSSGATASTTKSEK
jgi:transposase-like protein